MADVQLVLIGAGNMGEALLRGVLAAGVMAPADVAAVEPRAERRTALGASLGIAMAADLAAAPAAEAYVLAVKPQQMPDVLPVLAGRLPAAGALVISMAAGITTRHLAAGLGPAARIVRTMPSTPMLVGRGCTGLCRGPGATEKDIDLARRLFASAGVAVVLDEPALDAVTAVSGSGPAYFFYLIEAIVAAGVAEGLDEATALVLARQTCAGAAELLARSGEPPADLRAKVTSPGGTTQAAIAAMDAAGVKDAITRAVRAAAARSRELGK